MSLNGINVTNLGKSVNVFSVPPNVVLVSGSGNLPPPTANLYPLASNTIYQFAGLVNIGNAGVVLGNNTALQGTCILTDGLISTSTSGVIFADTKTNFLEHFLLFAPAGPALNLSSTGQTATRINDILFTGCQSLGVISGVATLSLQDNFIIGNTNGLTIYGPSTYCRITQNRTINNGPTFSGFIFTGASQIQNLLIEDNLMVMTGLETALVLPSGIAASGSLSSNDFGSAGTIVTGGIFKSDIRWRFSSNSNLADSVRVGSIGLSGNAITTTFAATNQFVLISGFSRTGQAMERFIMSNSGTFQYIGLEPCQVAVNFNGYYSINSASSTNMGFAFAKNNIVVGDAYYEANTTVSNTPASVALNGVLNLVTNDTLAVYVTNRTNTTAALVGAYNFTVQ